MGFEFGTAPARPNSPSPHYRLFIWIIMAFGFCLERPFGATWRISIEWSTDIGRRITFLFKPFLLLRLPLLQHANVITLAEQRTDGCTSRLPRCFENNAGLHFADPAAFLSLFFDQFSCASSNAYCGKADAKLTSFAGEPLNRPCICEI